MPDTEYALEMLDISKAFPGVQALNGVSLRVRRGEVHALVGENGAGKSTLMKILSGAYQRDSGRILLDGQDVDLASTSRALALGIVMIYQETSLAPELTVAENIFMGRLPSRMGFWFDEPTMHREAQKVLDQMGATFDSRTQVKSLSPAQRQMTEICRAISMSAKVIVLDEPTASLTAKEVDSLLAVVRRLRAQGVALIYITHRLEEVFEVADQVTVLRDGGLVSAGPVSGLDEGKIVQMMVGRAISDLFPRRRKGAGKPVLRVSRLSSPAFRDVSLEVCAGEIVGLFGLVGSGRTDVARAIFGADRFTSGSVAIDGRTLTLRSPEDAIHAGIALAPEDRKGQGLVLGMPIRANITLPILRLLSRLFFLRPRQEQQLAAQYRQSLDIRAPSLETVTQSLSGGNQQKVVIAKWLAARPKILIVDEPTRGIDVGAKSEVHRLMDDLAAQGVGILMISSELPEVLGMSDRILIMYEGALAGELSRDEADEARVMFYASGQHLSRGRESAEQPIPAQTVGQGA
ncbi:MAG: sugar ABC transporter ATP-binding protein [Anaerolineae bacterium]|nr:sugar ABC transporter ATP-binding protein [Anaerolineae bacterium]